MAGAVEGGKSLESRPVSLPISRIRVIMKSSPDVTNINQDAVLLTAKATELFVKYLATYSYKHGSGKQNKELTYDDLSKTAEVSDTFQFLADILPKKISIAEYLKLLKKEEEAIDLEEVNEVEIDVDDDDDEEEEEDDDDDDDDDDEEEYVQEIEDDDDDDDDDSDS